MATLHRIHATRSGSHPTMGDWETDYTITYRYFPATRARWNRYVGTWEQPDPAVVEFVSITPGAGDCAFPTETQRELEMWAADWLAEHEDDAIELAEDAIEDARERAAELKAER